jgi:hypothetical protein
LFSAIANRLLPCAGIPAGGARSERDCRIEDLPAAFFSPDLRCRSSCIEKPATRDAARAGREDYCFPIKNAQLTTVY